ncbi:DUF6350 family protein [Propionicicella superfundia]|uniref:cell division protein PerM n=1 Tax=Propionicicella superfundia TaxID=348582 RepID=UPI0004287968|nr:DUF6350 family protein [Propionicicella superfundia]
MPTRQRNSDHVSLQVATPSDSDSGAPRSPFGGLVPQWILGGATGALGVILGGWLLVSVWALVGWGTEMKGSVGTVLVFATRAWLAGNGTGLLLGSTLMTVVPLGLTVASLGGLAATGFFAARTGRGEDGEDEPAAPSRVVLQTTIAATVAYVGVVVVLALAFTEPLQAARGLGTSLVIAVLAAGGGACAGVRLPVLDLLPGWVRWGARAVGAGLAVLVVLAVATFVVALVAHWDRIMALSAELNLAPVPAAVLFLGQGAFWPNYLLWAGSWALGGGLSIGSGTAVTVVSTTLGLLPAFPVLGALPQAGAAEPGQVFWLAGGVVAGAVAGVLAVRSWWAEDESERVEIAGAVGLAAGLATAACWVALAAVSRGDLGATRLIDVGPRLLELAGFSAGLLGISGALFGTGYAVWLSRKASLAGLAAGASSPGDAADDADATRPLPRSRSDVDETAPLPPASPGPPAGAD